MIYFGIEIGLSWHHHVLMEQVEWTYIEEDVVTGAQSVNKATSHESIAWTSLHLPVMLKAYIPTQVCRVSLGLGVDYALSSWSKGSFEVSGGEIKGQHAAFTALKTQDVDSLYLRFAVGLEFDMGDFYIPVDLIVGYNTSQRSAYLQRGTVDQIPSVPSSDLNDHPTTLTLKTRDTAYATLRLGIGCEF